MQDVSDFQKEIEDDMKWQIKESKNNEKIIKDQQEFILKSREKLFGLGFMKHQKESDAQKQLKEKICHLQAERLKRKEE